MKRTFYTSTFFCIALAIVAQTPVNLNTIGTVTGTEFSVDYDNGNSQSTTVNTIANCFDGDFNTYFAAYQRDEGWVGLDLGAKYVITQVKFCPRTTQSDRIKLGVFEGANNADFGDAVPLYVIPESVPEGQFTTANINSSKGYRYVRYIGRRDVRCNIAELEFWGYQSDGDNSHVGQVTNLPTIAIHTVDNQIIDSKDNYVKGIVSVIDGDYFYTDSLDIRGRGNASWGFPKKPYRMKLFNKVKLLGNPAKEKNWTLINNFGDKTLMRNLIAFDISRRYEMPYTSVGTSVDVVLNGEYVGTYQLCDQMEVADDRIETDKLKPEDTALPKLSGGYLIEVDGYAYENPPEPVKFRSPLKNVPVTIKYPKDDEIVQVQWDYIENHFNAMESAILANNYTDEANGYRRYIDVATFVRHFLIGELSGNTDTYWSVYMVKKRDDDKFYFGPVWDFDIAFENDSRTYPINEKPDWIYRHNGSSAGDFKDLVTRMLSDPYMLNEIKDTWAQYRNSGIISADVLCAVIDSYVAELNASQQLNFTRWNIMNEYTHMMWARGDYANNVLIVKNYIRDRITWIDNKLQYIASAVESNELKNVTVFATNNTLYIKNIAQQTQVLCFDVTGKTVFETQTSADFTKPLPAGAYIVQLVSPNGEKRGFKIIL
ncbi:MAG: CotH kinase family protein [Prevotellaceae bacterium]|jgi:hypothetical protein|nr:CotH kinase family protein [Prevotellaceae bacterium]